MGFREFYKRHEKYAPLAFFIMGFLFDAVMLTRIDEPLVIVQQALYLVVASFLIAVELVETRGPVMPPRWVRGVWVYRKGFLHFMLGTLLNSYTIFYFMSSSTFTSFLFIGVLVGLLIVNEFLHFDGVQERVHVGFWALCVISYFVSLAPIALGHVGVVPFLLANVVAAGIFHGAHRVVTGRLRFDRQWARRSFVMPVAGVQGAFVLLYFLKVIPPVPLSVKYMGIFHGVEKKHGEYELSYTRPWWKFWQHGDEIFSARPGDVIHCYVQVFSPSRFKDELKVRWMYYDKRAGWLSADAIPLAVLGGREEGFRAVTTKANYQPGEWRVQVETRDGRQIGSIGFSVEMDTSAKPRETRVLKL